MYQNGVRTGEGDPEIGQLKDSADMDEALGEMDLGVNQGTAGYKQRYRVWVWGPLNCGCLIFHY